MFGAPEDGESNESRMIAELSEAGFVLTAQVVNMAYCWEPTGIVISSCDCGYLAHNVPASTAAVLMRMNLNNKFSLEAERDGHATLRIHTKSGLKFLAILAPVPESES